MQDVYIELLKEKKTMKFEQIKKIYMTLTEGMFGFIKVRLSKFCFKRIRICWPKLTTIIMSNLLYYYQKRAGKVVLEVFLETGEEDYVLHGQLESFVAYISQRTHPNSFKPTVFQTFTEDKELLYVICDKIHVETHLIKPDSIKENLRHTSQSRLRRFT